MSEGLVKKTILVACGTAIATATVVAEKLRTGLRKYGIDAYTIQCKAAEVAFHHKIAKPDLIVATTFVRKDLGTPVIWGICFLTGREEEETLEKIANLLKGGGAPK